MKLRFHNKAVRRLLVVLVVACPVAAWADGPPPLDPIFAHAPRKALAVLERCAAHKTGWRCTCLADGAAASASVPGMMIDNPIGVGDVQAVIASTWWDLCLADPQRRRP